MANSNVAATAADFNAETGAPINSSRHRIITGALAAAVLPAAAAVALPVFATSGPSLSELIEQHRSKLDSWREAANIEESASYDTAEMEARKPICVPVVVLPSGKNGGSGSYQIGLFSPEAIRERIDEAHEAIQRAHCSKFAKAMFPELASQVESSMAASKARAYARLEEAEAKWEAQKSRHREARTALDAADEDEHLARLALVLYRPKNAAEAAEKVAYIESFVSFYDFCYDIDERFIRGMVAALGTVPGNVA